MATNRTKTKSKGRRLGNLFGHSATSVIRTLGKKKVPFKVAKAALHAKRVNPSDATIRIMLSAGKLNNRGAAAPLTGDQLSELKTLGEKAMA